MERYIGGTEIQLGVIPLNGQVSEDQVTRQKEANILVERLIDTNNQTRLYGIPTANLADLGVGARLFNGGLLYQDIGHPEYATPECRSLDEVATYEMAGRRIVENLLRLETFTNPTHTVFANNTDHHGNTFAYHENYLVNSPDNVVTFMLPFLVTRQIFCGAGLMLTESLQQRLEVNNWFAISQRSLATEAMGHYLKVGQYSNFAGASRHTDNLLHITGGDANFTKDTTKLKIGTTALVQQMIEDGFTPPLKILPFSLSDVCQSLRDMALDQNCWDYHTGQHSCPAIEVQRIYFAEAEKRFKSRDQDTDWTLKAWEMTLNQLEADPLKATWVDWVRKFNFIAPRFGSSRWTRQDLIRVDLSFHAADPDKSILRLLGGTGVDDAKINHAMYHPPQDTRAAGRSLAIRALDPIIALTGKLPNITWHSITFDDIASLDMPDSRRTYLEEALRFKSQIEVF